MPGCHEMSLDWQAVPQGVPPSLSKPNGISGSLSSAASRRTIPLQPPHKQHPIAKKGPQGIWWGTNSLLTIVCPSNFARTNPADLVHFLPLQGLALIRLYVTKRSLACPAWREEHAGLSKQYPPARSHCTWDIAVPGALSYKQLLFLLHLELVI